jgi:mevalonate kinase
MPAITASAPGKAILFGEHAVVYGRPAIAVPISHVRSRAVVMAEPLAPAGHVHITAPDIGLDSLLSDLPSGHPIAVAIHGVLSALEIDRLPACSLRVTSKIPMASGLGSGASVSVAIIRAISSFLGRPLPDARVSELAYEAEKIHHGTPSGIDNTVVAFARPVYYVRGLPLITLHVSRPFTLVIGDTGVSSPTAIAVGELRKAWQDDPRRYESLFDAVGGIAGHARKVIESGQPADLGELMNRNHELLRQMGVSSPELNHLVESAQQAGAWGAKMSGAGRGGNMIALVSTDQAEGIAQKLLSSGALQTIITTVR